MPRSSNQPAVFIRELLQALVELQTAKREARIEKRKLADAELFVSHILEAEKIKDPELRKEAIEAAMRPLPPARSAGPPPSSPR
jgi:hypothetical protein